MSLKEKYKEAFRVEGNSPAAAIPLYLEIYKPLPKNIIHYQLGRIAKWSAMVFFILAILLGFPYPTEIFGIYMASLCFMLHFLGVAFIYFKLKFAKTKEIPKPITYRALVIMGLIRCYMLTGKTDYAKYYASKITSLPSEAFKRVASSVISALYGDIKNAIYLIDIAKINPSLPRDIMPDYIRAIDRCLFIYKHQTPSRAPGISIQGFVQRRKPVIHQKKKPISYRSEFSPVEKETAGKIRILRETENIQGYIVLKIAVENNSHFVITDVNIDLRVDDKVFRVEKVEPEYKRKGDSIYIPNINGNEKKTVAFYLDPKICTTSMIDAIISYKDHEGKIHTAPMKTKKVSVSCPIFFTTEAINIAMMKNLLSRVLHQQDCRIYTIPEGITLSKAFDLAREVMSGRDVFLVRDHITYQPFQAVAWYFGETKVEKHRIVVKIEIDEKEKVIVLFAATDNGKVLTGLLAEMGRNLRERLEREGKTTTLVTNIQIRDSIINRSNLSLSEDEVGKIKIQDPVVNRSNNFENLSQ